MTVKKLYIFMLLKNKLIIDNIKYMIAILIKAKKKVHYEI